jgi:hypothetical protein
MRTARRFFSWVGFAAGLLGGLALAGCFNLLTYVATYNAPAADGPRQAGFPLSFWWSGGLTPPGAPTSGWNRAAAGVDAVFAAVMAAGIGTGAGFALPLLAAGLNGPRDERPALRGGR